WCGRGWGGSGSPASPPPRPRVGLVHGTSVSLGRQSSVPSPNGHRAPDRPQRTLRTNKPDVTRRRWMALCFALGSTCFLIGPFPGYAQLVGDAADGITFFVGSILFTLGGALQSSLAWPERRTPEGGRAAWWAA